MSIVSTHVMSSSSKHSLVPKKLRTSMQRSDELLFHGAMRELSLLLFHVHDTTTLSNIITHPDTEFISDMPAAKSTSLRLSIFMGSHGWLALWTHNFSAFVYFRFAQFAWPFSIPSSSVSDSSRLRGALQNRYQRECIVQSIVDSNEEVKDLDACYSSFEWRNQKLWTSRFFFVAFFANWGPNPVLRIQPVVL